MHEKPLILEKKLGLFGLNCYANIGEVEIYYVLGPST